MKKVDLVFRTVGERTTDIALELAKKHIRPDRIHLLQDVKPFTETVRRQLQIDYDCDYVVFMDADCLVMEEMRDFIERTDLPYIDCYVYDKFRGKLHTGIHITRVDLVREMARVEPPQSDMKYVLRPESRVRAIALKRLKMSKAFKHFRIYHDYHQSFADIFSKYALRELRSRTAQNRSKLDAKMEHWNEADPDHRVAREATEFTHAHVSQGATPEQVHDFIVRIPEFAAAQTRALGLHEKAPLTWDEVMATTSQEEQDAGIRKIFGIGLSRTGTKSLTKALNSIGYTISHYPTDETTYEELAASHYKLRLLEYFDGITDITVAPYYAQLDQLFPQSKFILTVRDKDLWLEAMERHWNEKPVLATDFSLESRMALRRLLRLANYGTFTFEKERMSFAYDHHVRGVLEYFKDRPQDLLIMDVTAGEGWEKLCPFLGRQPLEVEFPHNKKKSDLDE